VSAPAAVYHPRNPQSLDYYRCVEDYFESFVRIYDDHFSRQYGFWRPYMEQVIHRYLECGDLLNGFACVKCKDHGHEYLLALSCKSRRLTEIFTAP
jgi:hypothetical protein